jgi:hypothetical protein
VPPHLAHRGWTVAYFASWVLAAGGACGLVAAVWSLRSDHVIDERALPGIAFGVVLGFLAARSTVQRRGVHRLLAVGGVLAAAAGIAGAMRMFAAAKAARGDGPFAGMGEVVVGVALAAVAAIGVACLAAGTTGWLAARTAPELR